MFDMERHPWCFTSRYFRRSFFQTIRNCVPRARCIYRLCTFMHLSSSYLLPASLWNTFRHTDLYENKGTLGGAFGERKLNFCSAVERFREEEYFLPSYRWPSVTTYRKGDRTCSIINSTIVFSLFTLKTGSNDLYFSI